jgi:photosystem II stability/assembly factor-like uncharacterized protein
MKKILFYAALPLLIIVGFAYNFTLNYSIGEFSLEHPARKSSAVKAMRAKEAMEYRAKRLADEYGNINPSLYLKAVQSADQIAATSSRAGALGLEWEELGPDNVGGRVRAILIDKRDPSNNTLYAGGVSGGLWKSTDGASSWKRVTTWNDWVSVSCITQSTEGTIIIGTGEGDGLAQSTSSSLSSGAIGNGVYKLDANDAPTQITPNAFTGNVINNNSPWSFVNRVAVNPNDENQIMAATHRGLYRTLDGGATWTAISVVGVNATAVYPDVKWANDGVNIFASSGQFGSSRFVRSLNGGFSFELVSNSNTPTFPSTSGRIEIAIAPTNPNIVYLSVATSNGGTDKVLRTADGGDTWTVIGNKGPLFDPFLDQNQGWYDNTIAVSPQDVNKVYLGGVVFYTWSDQSGWKLADVGLGGTDDNPNFIHSDKHAIVIAQNNPNIMYVGSDGGIYKSTNAVSAFPFPTYSAKNRGFNVTQFYSIAAGVAGEVLGGTQDNGTQYINYKGNTRMAAKRLIGGDGIYAEISHLDPRIMFGGVYFGNLLRSGNGGSSFDGFFDLKIDNQGHVQPSTCGGQKDANAQFITPFYLSETRNATGGLKTVKFVPTRNYDAGEVVTLQSKTAKATFQYEFTSSVAEGDTQTIADPIRSRMFLSSNCGPWVTSECLDLSNTPKWFRVMSNMNGLAQSYSATPDGNTVYIGTSSGRVYKFPNFNSRSDTARYLSGTTLASVTNIYTNSSQYTNVAIANGRAVEGVSVDPNNENHAVAVLAGFSSAGTSHVFETTNGGVTWQSIQANLPNMPVYDVVISKINGAIIVGSELGLWSYDGTSWYEENQTINRVPVFRVREIKLYEDACPVLYIGTHGRGLWRSTTLIGNTACAKVASINNPTQEATQVSDLNIFPNPVNSSSKVAVTLNKSSTITLRVFDMTGKLFSEQTVSNTVVGENLFNLDAANLPNGTYLLNVAVGNVRSQSRLFTVAK